MAKGLVEQSSLTAIADAIRAKGVEGSWKPAEMAGAIASIQGGGGDSEKFYENAEEAYQDLRPKHWPTMPDATTLLSGDDDTSAGIWVWLIRSPNQSITLSINDNQSNSRVIPYIYQNSTWNSLNKYWYWDGETLNLTSYMTLNPTDNMYECVLGLKDTSSGSSTFFFFNNSNFTLSYSTSMKYIVDLDAYYNSTENISNSNYLNGNVFANVFRGLWFLRLRKKNRDTAIVMQAMARFANLRVIREHEWNVESTGKNIYSPLLQYYKLTTYGTGSISQAITNQSGNGIGGRQIEITHRAGTANGYQSLSLYLGQEGYGNGNCRKIKITFTPDFYKAGSNMIKSLGIFSNITITSDVDLEVDTSLTLNPLQLGGGLIGCAQTSLAGGISYTDYEKLLDYLDKKVVNGEATTSNLTVRLPSKNCISEELLNRVSSWPNTTIAFIIT